MKLIFVTILLSWSVESILAQFDPEAKKYLDELAAAVNSCEGVAIDFEIETSNLSGKKELEKLKGQLFFKQNRHKLVFNDTQIYGDGDTQWIFYPQEHEVTIQPLEEGELTPASVFKLYQKGYRFRLLKETKENVIVELSPEDRNSPYVRIALEINIALQQMNSFVTQDKNGLIATVKITQWDNKMPENQILIFDPGQYPEIEIIDLR